MKVDQRRRVAFQAEDTAPAEGLHGREQSTLEEPKERNQGSWS